MHITLVESFFSGSHRRWARELQSHSRHDIELLTLPGRFWKWRMYGGAPQLAGELLQKASPTDLLLATDMLDLAGFLGLIRHRYPQTPAALYFHENQITYPWSPDDHDPRMQRNNQYGFINFTSALAADAVAFNSAYHRRAFLEALPPFLRQFPDHQLLDRVDRIRERSRVLPLGMDLKKLDNPGPVQKADCCTILWNHRWEYDKGPEAFFSALFRLQEEDLPFRLIVLGEGFSKSPAIFAEAREKLADRILHFGYEKDPGRYRTLLWQADLLPVTGIQDFFGGSVVEAMYCQTMPLLPRRLAYPDHIPPAEQSRFLYEAPDFHSRLRRAVVSLAQTRTFGEKAATFVQHYDWRQQIAEYDTFLAGLRPND